MLIFVEEMFIHGWGVYKMMQQELESVFGPKAIFRGGQKEAIVATLSNKRTLVVQRTGWGKSLVYFLATKIKRKQGEGVTLVVSPLLSLMRNQEESVEAYGLVAGSIHSKRNSSESEMDELINRCNQRECDVLFITPERLANEGFLKAITKLNVGMLVIDEAHCISDWGHDFRPDYRRISKLIPHLPSNISILATTATATEKVIKDIQDQIGNCIVFRGPLVRKSIHLHKVKLNTREAKFAWLKLNIPFFEGSGIIYATTIKECNIISKWLQFNNIDADAYHSDIGDKQKLALETRLINNNIKVLVSTIALGMGFDKRDLSFVIHYYTPKSVVEYYQQVGRAGRAVENALCVLMYGDKEEIRINQFFIQNSFPKQSDFNQVLNVLESEDSLKINDIYNSVNIKNKVCDQVIKLLLLDGYIVKNGTYYSRTIKTYSTNSTYYEGIILEKQKDYEQMQEYQNTGDCLMAFLTNALDDPQSQPCGHCSNCRPKQTFTHDILSVDKRENVKDYLSQQFNLLRIKKKSVLKNRNLKYICSQGFALSYYHDEIGQMAKQGKYELGTFSDTLVEASVLQLKKFLARQHQIDKNTLLVVPIPSVKRPNLVPSFAKRIAEKLNIDYYPALEKLSNAIEQKAMLNSQNQERNVRENLCITEGTPDLSLNNILLIDDFVDSGWTFTVAAELLGDRYHCEEIIPFAVAITSQNNN